MCHTLHSYGKACPHACKSHHTIIYVLHHMVSHENVAHNTFFKIQIQYTMHNDTGMYTYLKNEVHIIYSLFMYISYLGVPIYKSIIV